MSSNQTIVIRGELHWAKIVGAAVPHTGSPKYDKGPYWSVDITPDAKSRKVLKAASVEGKLKTDKSGARKETYIQLKVLENKADGTKNKSPNIVDLQGNPWDGSKIGNGSIADVKVKVVDYGAGSDKGAYLQAVRVLQHIPYESNSFEPLSEDDKFFGAAKADEKAAAPANGFDDDELDDDIPF